VLSGALVLGFVRHHVSALAASPRRFDDAVARTPECDRFCSSSPWALSAYEAFHDDTEPFVLELDSGWAALMLAPTQGLGRCAFPLEATWGFASALIGPDPRSVVRDLAAALDELRGSWDSLYLLGLKREGLAFQELVRCFARRFTLGIGRTTVRCVASLDGGEHGFLSRRSAGFRENLRRADRRAVASGFTFERAVPTNDAETERVMARILSVERRSWKGLDGDGIDRGRMLTFYKAMFPRLVARGCLRAGFVTRDGDDVAFIVGGIADGSYRGLQVSFVNDGPSDLGLGNLAQLGMIRWLIEDGCAVYDLGQDMPYKHRWSEQRVTSVALVVRA
jgi:CelD/BcsL family acetyltransferase involved in cellulose biosynthesis